MIQRDPARLGVFGVTAAAEVLVGPALASLPETLQRTAVAAGSIHVVDGRLPDWPTAIGHAARADAAGVFVLDPCVPERSAFDDGVGLTASVPIWLDLAWTAHPAIRIASAPEPGPIRAVTANGSVHRPEGLGPAMLDATLAASRLMGALPSVRRVEQGDWSASAAGRWGDVVFRLSVVRSAAAGRTLELTTHADAESWVAQLPDPATATPAVVTRTDAGGARTPPTEYQTARRAGLLALADVVRTGQRVNDLQRYRQAAVALGLVAG
jgi:hypothetical protein